jgi:glutaminase
MSFINYDHILRTIADDMQTLPDSGKVASYIPELASINPNKFGMYLNTVSNQSFTVGDADERFSIQSISKVFSLTLALKLLGRKIWERVGHEPSGTAFNSLVQLEYEHGVPRNPFINAGAIVICDILISQLANPQADMLAFIRSTSANQAINVNHRIAASESATSHRNRALIHLMRDFGNIHNDVDEILDFYFHLCSIEMTCKELAESCLYLAANGINPRTGDVIIIPRRAKRINSIMQLCGFYDEAGEFAFSVGLPGKSGVGGGIIAVHPGKFSIAVWSPPLNPKGNSYKGMKALEAFTTRTSLSIF